VWWALGAGYLIWPLLTFPLLLSLLMQRTLRVPRGFSLWLLFLGWMLVSGLQLSGFSFMFFWRAAVYGSATVLFLYVYNAPRRQLADRAIIGALVLFWLEVVAAGYLGVLFPHVSFRAPLASVVPGYLARDGVAQAMLHPGFAEVMTFLGYPVGRPKALFAYSNHWGACVAVLTPFAIAAMTQMRRGLKRQIVGAALLLSVVPVVVSLDRAVWIALVVGLGYGALRSARRSSARARAAGIATLAIAVAAVAATPLATLAGDRVGNDSQSTITRLTVYDQTKAAVEQSPLFGYGSPKATSRAAATGPPAGTQGQIPLVVYSHGVPGFLFFVAWFAYGLIRSRARASAGRFAAHLALLVAAIEMPFYSLLPTTLHVLMVASALAWRDIEVPATERVPDISPTRRPAPAPAAVEGFAT
jgi:polysaccharide biosynthesis protein PslJ